MRISVALCTYNGRRYLPAQLASIASQSRLPDELVVCDDASNDNTKELLHEFAATVPFTVRVVENASRLGSTLNFGKAIYLCEGEIIALADQDDVWHDNKLACIEDAFVASPELGLVFSDGELIDENGLSQMQTLWQSIRFGRREQSAIRRGKAFAVLLRRNVVTGATVAFRGCWKSLILPIPRTGWVHDQWIAQLIAAVSPIDFIDAPLINYRCHSGQQLGLTGKRSLAKLWQRIENLANFDIYLSAADSHVHALAHLQTHGPANQEKASALEKLGAKIMHMRFRGSLPASRWRRIPLISSEIINLGYSRYSLGLPSVLLDFFAKKAPQALESSKTASSPREQAKSSSRAAAIGHHPPEKHKA